MIDCSGMSLLRFLAPPAKRYRPQNKRSNQFSKRADFIVMDLHFAGVGASKNSLLPTLLAPLGQGGQPWTIHWKTGLLMCPQTRALPRKQGAVPHGTMHSKPASNAWPSMKRTSLSS